MQFLASWLIMICFQFHFHFQLGFKLPLVNLILFWLAVFEILKSVWIFFLWSIMINLFYSSFLILILHFSLYWLFILLLLLVKLFEIFKFCQSLALNFVARNFYPCLIQLQFWLSWFYSDFKFAANKLFFILYLA